MAEPGRALPEFVDFQVRGTAHTAEYTLVVT
jgi:hypothetical protein